MFLAHSQGSVVIYYYLKSDINNGNNILGGTKTDVITFGSPLGHIYQHYFREYAGLEPSLERLATRFKATRVISIKPDARQCRWNTSQRLSCISRIDPFVWREGAAGSSGMSALRDRTGKFRRGRFRPLRVRRGRRRSSSRMAGSPPKADFPDLSVNVRCVPGAPTSFFPLAFGHPALGILAH